MFSTYHLRASAIALGIFVQAAAVAGPIIDSGDLHAARLSEYWVANIPLAEGDAVRAVHLLDDTLYVISENGTVYSVEAYAGLIRWAKKLGDFDLRVPPPTHYQTLRGGGPAIFNLGGEVLLLDRYSGETVLRFRPEFPPSSMAVGGGGRLFLAGMNRRFYALGALDPRRASPLKLWEVASGGLVFTKPVLYGNGKVLFATRSGNVFSCFTADKAFDWAYCLGGEVHADPVVASDGVYIASTNRSLFKLDPARGNLVWQSRFSRALNDSPVIAGDFVYQAVEAYGLVAMDAADGRELWRVPQGTTLTARLKDHDLVLTTDGNLAVVARASGEVAHQLNTTGVRAAASNALTDASYLAAADGTITCIRPIDTPYLKPLDVNLVRGRLNRSPLNDLEALDVAGKNVTTGTQAQRIDPLRSRNDRR